MTRLRWGLGGLLAVVALVVAAQALQVYLRHGLWLGAASVAVLVIVLLGGLVSLGLARRFLARQQDGLAAADPGGELLLARRARLTRLREQGVTPDLDALETADAAELAGRGYLGRYVVATAVLVGLIGTFAGLMETLRRVAPLLEDRTGGRPSLELLAAPLAGLDVTFGASIVGILVTLALSLVQGDLGLAEESVLARLEERVRHEIVPALWPRAGSEIQQGLALLAETRGEITGLRSDLAGLRGDAAALRAGLSVVEGALGTVRSELGQVSGRVEGLSGRLGELPAELATAAAAAVGPATLAVAETARTEGERLAERAARALEAGVARLGDLTVRAAGEIGDTGTTVVEALASTTRSMLEVQASRGAALDQAQAERVAALDQAQADRAAALDQTQADRAALLDQAHAARAAAFDQAEVARVAALDRAESTRVAALDQAEAGRVAALERLQASALAESRAALLEQLQRAVRETHQELATLVEHHGVTLGETTQALLLDVKSTLGGAGQELTRAAAELLRATGELGGATGELGRASVEVVRASGTLDDGSRTLGAVLREVAPDLSGLGSQLGALSTELALVAARSASSSEVPQALLEEVGRLGQGLDRLLLLAELGQPGGPEAGA